MKALTSYPGNMRRANHGSFCLPVQANQDRRVEHQKRQVERRELRKRLRAAQAESAALKAKAEQEPPVKEVVAKISRKEGVLTVYSQDITRKETVARRSNERFEPKKWVPPVGGNRG